MLTKIQQLIAIIQIGDTGTSKDISIKLGVSERMVYKYIEILKTEFKAPLKYNSLNKTYFFDGKGKLDLCWQKKKKD
jgi:DNA-binding CsgD family transcriptional regulator